MESFNLDALINISVMLAVFVLPFVVGVYFAKAIRMADYGWKVGLILSTLAVGTLITVNGIMADMNKQGDDSQSPGIKLGVDLAGGVILIYEIDLEASSASQDQEGTIKPADVAAALRPRLNPTGSSDIVIRPYGDYQIEIIIPSIDNDEVDNIKRLISTSGVLEFRILVNRDDPKHNRLVELAEQQRASDNVGIRQSRFIYGSDAQVGVDKPEATWVKLALTDKEDPDEQAYKFDPAGSAPIELLRDGESGNWITFSEADATNFDVSPEEVREGLDDMQAEFEKERNEKGSGRGSIVYIRDTLGVDNPEVLVATDNEREVRGGNLSRASQTTDLSSGRPAISFTMDAEGSQNLAILTSRNVNDSDIQRGLYRYLSIVLDGRLLSAPRLQSTISNQGQITGDFSQEELDFLVNILRAGRLPAVLNPEPTSENRIDPLLGQATIESGRWAIGISLAAVLAFMVFYYRFAGIVACFALAINLLLIVAIMIQFKAAFTLPGLAGLVLTVGMSVDANVLIFERIREERARGAALRMAIRNGFGRATTTIVDANLTTLITAVVLYGIGTDQIRGFALTLIFGILMSMYTAIFCSRVVFDIAERKRWKTNLHMMQALGTTNWNFIGKRMIAGIVSGILILVGVGAIVERDTEIFDIDFTGGTSAQIVMQEPMQDSEVRDLVYNNLDPAYKELLKERLANIDPSDEAAKKEIESLRRDQIESTVTGLNVRQANEQGKVYDPGTLWKIDTSIPDSDLLEEALAKVFQTESGESMLVSHHLDVNNVQQMALAPAPDLLDTEPNDNQATDPSATPPATETNPTETNPTETPATETPATETPAVSPVPENTPAEPMPNEETPPAETTPPENTEPAATESPETPTQTEPAPPEPMPEEPQPEPTPEPEPPATETPEPETAEPETTEPAEPAATESQADDPRQAEPRPPVAPLEAGARLQDAANLLAQGAFVISPTFAFIQNEADTTAESDQPVSEEPTQEPLGIEPDPETAEESATDPTAEADTEATPVDADRSSPRQVKPESPAATRQGSQGTRFTLKFDHKVSAETVVTMVRRACVELGREVPRVEFIEPTWNGESKETNIEWTVQVPLEKEQATPLINKMQESINQAPVFLSVSKIGGSVAGNTRNMAIAALAASLLGIVAYIWFRFQKVVYGLAAVVALVHDVLIVIGAIAISAYLAPFFGFLLIEEFKISLPIVAALLTIIGYSLNDTIVVFDRIREVKGKNPLLTGEMINTSINQTLSRTLLTSVTTLIVVSILYALGGDGIHGFAFALLIGVFVGTYSSVFVASPILLWLGGEKSSKPSKSSKAA